MTPPVDIAGLRVLVERATPGPWVAEVENGEVLAITRPGDEVAWHISAPNSALSICDADLAFVLAARTAVPALCDRVEELERLLATMRVASQSWAESALRHEEENARLRVEVANSREAIQRWGRILGVPEDRFESLLSLPALVESVMQRKADGEGGVG